MMMHAAMSFTTPFAKNASATACHRRPLHKGAAEATLAQIALRGGRVRAESARFGIGIASEGIASDKIASDEIASEGVAGQGMAGDCAGGPIAACRQGSSRAGRLSGYDGR
jgi:hypothetical protein